MVGGVRYKVPTENYYVAVNKLKKKFDRVRHNFTERNVYLVKKMLY